jgi:hypothetical protein
MLYAHCDISVGIKDTISHSLLNSFHMLTSNLHCRIGCVGEGAGATEEGEVRVCVIASFL